METNRVIANGYNRMGEDFAAWNATRPPAGRRWFLGEVLERLPPGCDVLELGCGPGTDASALSDRRRYVGIDLSSVQLSIARREAPGSAFVVGDLTKPPFVDAAFDAIVAFYAFNHVPSDRIAPAIMAAFSCLRHGGRLMLGGLPTTAADDRIEEWLDVRMFFTGIHGEPYDDAVRRAGFDIELSEIRFTIQESWGLNRPRWLIARKP